MVNNFFEEQTTVPSPERRVMMVIASTIEIAAKTYAPSQRAVENINFISEQLVMNGAKHLVNQRMLGQLKADIELIRASSLQLVGAAIGRPIERIGNNLFRVMPIGEDGTFRIEPDDDAAKSSARPFDATGFEGFDGSNAIFSDSLTGRRLIVPADQFEIGVAMISDTALPENT